MKIDRTQSDNITINLANSKNANEEDNSFSAKKSKNHSNTIYAGNLNKNNKIESTKQQAQKQALKTIIDEFKKELKSNDTVSSLRDKQATLSKDMDLAASQVLDLRKKQQELKDSYGISDDSTEQINLDLLKKSIYGTESLTEDEFTELKNMGPLTEYQKSSLQYDAATRIWQQRVDSAANGITNVTHAITGISLAKLKTHPMTDAQKEATNIIEEMSNKIIGIIIQETKENFDDTVEKNKEEAKKAQEAQEKKDAETDKTDGSTLLASEQFDQLQLVDDLKRFVEKQNMLDEDIKGIVVDEQV